MAIHTKILYWGFVKCPFEWLADIYLSSIAAQAQYIGTLFVYAARMMRTQHKGIKNRSHQLAYSATLSLHTPAVCSYIVFLWMASLYPLFLDMLPTWALSIHVEFVDSRVKVAQYVFPCLMCWCTGVPLYLKGNLLKCISHCSRVFYVYLYVFLCLCVCMKNNRSSLLLLKGFRVDCAS